MESVGLMAEPHPLPVAGDHFPAFPDGVRKEFAESDAIYADCGTGEALCFAYPRAGSIAILGNATRRVSSLFSCSCRRSSGVQDDEVAAAEFVTPRITTCRASHGRRSMTVLSRSATPVNLYSRRVSSNHALSAFATPTPPSASPAACPSLHIWCRDSDVRYSPSQSILYCGNTVAAGHGDAADAPRSFTPPFRSGDDGKAVPTPVAESMTTWLRGRPSMVTGPDFGLPLSLSQRQRSATPGMDRPWDSTMTDDVRLSPFFGPSDRSTAAESYFISRCRSEVAIRRTSTVSAPSGEWLPLCKSFDDRPRTSCGEALMSRPKMLSRRKLTWRHQGRGLYRGSPISEQAQSGELVPVMTGSFSSMRSGGSEVGRPSATSSGLVQRDAVQQQWPVSSVALKSALRRPSTELFEAASDTAADGRGAARDGRLRWDDQSCDSLPRPAPGSGGDFARGRSPPAGLQHRGNRIGVSTPAMARYYANFSTPAASEPGGHDSFPSRVSYTRSIHDSADDGTMSCLSATRFYGQGASSPTRQAASGGTNAKPLKSLVHCEAESAAAVPSTDDGPYGAKSPAPARAVKFDGDAPAELDLPGGDGGHGLGGTGTTGSGSGAGVDPSGSRPHPSPYDGSPTGAEEPTDKRHRPNSELSTLLREFEASATPKKDNLLARQR